MVDIAQLSYSIDTSSVTSATAALDQHATAQGRVAQGAQTVANNTKLTAQQLAQMQFQLQDIAVGLSSGQSPFTVLTQQGSQLAQMFRSEAGVMGALRAVGTGVVAFVTNPINLAVLGFAAAAAAATAMYRAISGGSRSISDTLKEHERLIRQLKDAWGEAGKGVEAYAKESVAVLTFLEGIQQKQLAAQRAAAVSGIVMPHGPLDAVFGNPYAAFAPAFAALDKSRAAGNPDVLQFRDIVTSIASAPGASQATKDLGASLLAQTQSAADAQRAEDAYRLALEKSVPAITAATEAQKHLKQVTEESTEARKKAADAVKAGHDAYQDALDRNIKKTEELSKATSDTFKGIISDLRNGASAGEIFLHILERIMGVATDRLGDMLGDWVARQFGGMAGIRPPPQPNQINPAPFVGYDPTTGHMIGPRPIPAAPRQMYDPTTGQMLPASPQPTVTGGRVVAGPDGQLPAIGGSPRIVPNPMAGQYDPITGQVVGFHASGINMDAAGMAIRAIESGGGVLGRSDYGALGPITKSGDRAYGAYQVMGNNVGPWSERWIGQRMTPGQFLDAPWAQDQVFRGQFGQYATQYGGDMGMASQAWFGGPGSVGKLGRTDVLGTTVGGYGSQATQLYGIADSLTTASKAAQKAAGGFAQAFPQALQSVTSAVSGKSGGLGGLFGGLFGGVDEFGLTGSDWASINTGILEMHGGGTVGSKGGFRRDSGSAADWARAPRLHNGLAPDEFRAVLQRGETVTPRGKSPRGGHTINYAPVYNVNGGSLSRGEITDLIDQRQSAAFSEFKREKGAFDEQFHMLREPS